MIKAVFGAIGITLLFLGHAVATTEPTLRSRGGLLMILAGVYIAVAIFYDAD